MFQVYCLAGGVAGVAEALVLNPFEVVKVAQQANKGIYTQVCELRASQLLFCQQYPPHHCEREDNCMTYHPYLIDSFVWMYLSCGIIQRLICQLLSPKGSLGPLKENTLSENTSEKLF